MGGRSRIVALLCASLTALAPAPASAAGASYSVSGKRGPFIDQIAARKFNVAAGQAARGLADAAVNQGANQTARLPMPQTEAKIAELLTRIEAGWPYAKGLPLTVHVQGVDYYSAYSLPDGSIVVGFGLLDRAQSDDEVAFVLAHELSHVRLGHFANDGGKAKRHSAGNRLGQLYVLASLASSARNLGGGRQGAAVFAGKATTAGRRVEATSDLLHFLNNAMIEPAWAQGEEDEADVLGFDLSHRGAFAAEAAAARVFDTIQADQVRRRQLGAALEGRFKRELGRTATDNVIKSALNSGGSRQEFKRGLAGSAGRMALSAATRNETGAAHRAPEDRKKGLGDYSTAAYRDLPLRDEGSAWLTGLRSTQEFADARIAVAAVAAAKTARADGDPAAAEVEIAKATPTSFHDTPLVLNEAGRIRGDLGDTAGADALFNRAHGSPDQTIDGYVDHVRMFYETGQGLNGFLVAKAGEDRFGDEKPFLALKIAIARQAKRKKEMNAFLKRCMKADDEALQQDCQQAAGKTPEPRRRRGIQVMGVGLG